MAETTKQLGHPEDANEITLRELVEMLWAGKWLVIGISGVATLVAIVVALLLPDVYRAEALLAPNDKEAAGGLSASASQYGGVASLAGINLNTGSSDRVALGLATLKSRRFISGFVERHNILVPLMAAEAWNPDSGTLIIDNDTYDSDSQTWLRKAKPPRKAMPSSQEAYEKFTEETMRVSQDKTNGLVTISVEHYSPAVAKQWVDWLVEDINFNIMQQDVTEAEQSIEYLREQVDATSLTDLQSVFFGLIEEQTKTIMLAKVSDEYFLKTLDPAIAPERRSKPNRVVIVLVTAFGSGLFAMAIVVLLGWRRPS